MVLIRKQKRLYRFFGGVAGLLVGGWLIFYYHDLRGILALVLGAILLLSK